MTQSSPASWLLWLVLAWLVGGAGVLTAAASTPAGAERVRVTGHAPAENPDRINAARLDAMRQAIQQAGGAQVRSHAATRLGELVSQFTYVRANGLVSSMQEAGPPAVTGGIYAQTFLVEVKPDALNRELVAQKIDVEFLYDLVRRPRIVVGVLDEWNPGEDARAAPVPDPDQSSNQQIVAAFKRRHPGFVFKELGLAAGGKRDEAEFVRESRLGNFELLIVGTTRTRLVSGPRPAARTESALSGAPSAAGGQPDTLAKLRGLMPAAAPEPPAFTATLDWRVINVSTAETVLVLSGDQPPRARADTYDLAAASRAAKLALLDERTAELFRELVGFWNQRAFSENYEIVFHTDGALAPMAIERILRERGGFSPDSVALTAAGGGRVSFTGTATLSRAEVAQALGEAFGPALAVTAVRPGSIELEPTGFSTVRSVPVKITGLSITDLRTIQTALGATTGVSQVQRQGFAEGKATLLLITTLGDEALGVAVEAALAGRLRVTALGAGGIEAAAAP